MKKELLFILSFCVLNCMAVTCNKNNAEAPIITEPKDSSLINLAHLNYLYTPVTFANGSNAAGIYIYAEAPDYHLVDASGEGFTCVDDVARAVQVYIRHPAFATDTALQNKASNLIEFLLQMQSDNGYFYNFLLTETLINKGGQTSINSAEWWSWRALYALTEAAPVIKAKNPQLATRMDEAVSKLVAKIKADLVNVPQTTKVVSGITVPQWLPAGSGTDQAAILILGLIPYATTTGDDQIKTYIKKLADGIVLMQQGDSLHFPYGAFLSWENTWHAYACDQVYALLKVSAFLNDPLYQEKALLEVDHFYPWLLKNGFLSSFIVQRNNTEVQMTSSKSFEQIAYGIRPMVFAAAEAYTITKEEKYADMAGHLAAWFLGTNSANAVMYSVTTGRCYDAINSGSSVNQNSGAESTIEALLAMEKVEAYPAIKAALNTYKKP
jgi:hypothetical protein